MSSSHRTCSVCKSKKGPMFSFPKESAKRESWRVFLGLEAATTFSQICLNHFHKEDMKEGNGRHRLVRNAFPRIKEPECVKPSQRRHTNNSAKPICIVPGCGNTARDDVSHHHFPRWFERRRQWATIVNLQKVPSKHCLICSIHFLPSDFYTAGTQKSLKSCATPSLHLEVPLNRSSESGMCQVVEGGTSNGGVLISNQEVSRPGQALSDSLHNSVELASPVIKRDSDSLCDVEESLEEQCEPPSIHQDRSVKNLHLPSTSQDEESSEELSVAAWSHKKTSSRSEAEYCQSLEEVLNSISSNVPDEISYVFKRLSDRVKSPSDSFNSSVSTVASFSTYEESHSAQTKPLKFGLFDLLHTDTQLKAFTGVTYATFNCLLKLVLELCGDVDDAKVPMKKKIFLTLCKLQSNISYECLSALVEIDKKRCRSYFTSTLHLLAVVLQDTVTWPSKKETMLNMPKCFQKFANTRVVLECFEMPVISPDCLKCRIHPYSHYKCGPTAKVLLGVAPSGLIIFVSQVYGGRASDEHIFEESGLLSKLDPRVDAVMVEKGFRIDDACSELGIQIYRSPFIAKKQPLNEANAKKNSEIANARVHVERVIQRMRSFKILRSKISWSMIPYLNEIVVVIAGLVNLSPHHF